MHPMEKQSSYLHTFYFTNRNSLLYKFSMRKWSRIKLPAMIAASFCIFYYFIMFSFFCSLHLHFVLIFFIFMSHSFFSTFLIIFIFLFCCFPFCSFFLFQIFSFSIFLEFSEIYLQTRTKSWSML